VIPKKGLMTWKFGANLCAYDQMECPTRNAMLDVPKALRSENWIWSNLHRAYKNYQRMSITATAGVRRTGSIAVSVWIARMADQFRAGCGRASS